MKITILTPIVLTALVATSGWGIESIMTGAMSEGVAINPSRVGISDDGHIAVAANTDDNSVSGVDMASGTVRGTIGPLGFEPQCLGFDASRNLVLVTSHSGEVWLLESNAIIGLTYTPTAVDVEN
jgi:DNA-binding beta-propeller fold protein YncE